MRRDLPQGGKGLGRSEEDPFISIQRSLFLFIYLAVCFEGSLV